ncbi:MAG: polyamine aminopropyltransferase [Kofleriaceae bacterium]|nr:polyamine aminopropyltransferase [Kofleriaceae bacterium]
MLGDSVTQFSLVIGLYLSAMGGGAWLSRRLETQLAKRFLEVELAVALVGGLSAPLLFLAFAKVANFQALLLGTVVAIGILVGLEIPLLMRLLEGRIAFKDLVSRVLTFDYIGALVAALIFPLLLVPKLGLIRSSLAVGMANALVALWGTWILRGELGTRAALSVRIRALLLLGLLGTGLVFADQITTRAEDEMYADPVVYTQTSAYQRIAVTSGRAGFQLFLNGNLQFSSADEYRYHEALVHPAFAAFGDGDNSLATGPRRVLVLGGGDGLAMREILKHPSVEAITLVDLDPAMTALSQRFPPLAKLNGNAMADTRVTVVNDDAMIWINNNRELFDIVIIDFPDPNSYALGKLYTKLFYRRLAARLAPGAAIVVQSTSPLFARNSYWCIVTTIQAAGFQVAPYHTTVPSFGTWGYVLAKLTPFEPPTQTPNVALRFLTGPSMAAMFVFPADMAAVKTDTNFLDNQALVRYYEREWRRWE